MDMVRHEAVRVETETELSLISRQPTKVELAIRVVAKDVTLLVTTRDDVIHGAGKFQPRRPRHQDEQRSSVSSVIFHCREQAERSDSGLTPIQRFIVASRLNAAIQA
jgi:hypothetical protein